MYIPDELPDDGLPRPKYVVSGIGKNNGLRDGISSTFICKHHNQNATHMFRLHMGNYFYSQAGQHYSAVIADEKL
jgi:hypothetical protein